MAASVRTRVPLSRLRRMEAARGTASSPQLGARGSARPALAAAVDSNKTGCTPTNRHRTGKQAIVRGRGNGASEGECGEGGG